MKPIFRITALAIVLAFISCKEVSEKQFDSTSLEKAKSILTEKSSYSQTITKFSDFLCECIENEKTTDNFIELNFQYDYCAKQYTNKYKDEISDLVLLLDSKLKENKNEYEIGKTTGNIIAREGNVLLARDCNFFQTEFEKIKKEIAKSMDSNSSNYETKIQILKNRIKI